MSRKKKLALYLGIIIIIIVYLFTYLELFFTWESAYRHLERNSHFGPATEIESVQDHSGRLIFARDENWFYPFYVREVYELFHRPEEILGRPLKLFNWPDTEEEEGIVFRERRFYTEHENITAFYAYADESIATIEIELLNGEILTMKEFSEGVYYDYYYSDRSQGVFVADYIEGISGYDDEGRLVFRKGENRPEEWR